MSGSAARASGSARPVAPAPRRLFLVPRGAYRAPKAPFVGTVVGVLGAALLCLLILNTQIARNSFTLSTLQTQNQALNDRQQALQQQVDSQAASNTLAARAQQLGMVPAGQPAFIRLPDGTILGSPKPATKPKQIDIKGVGPGHPPTQSDPSGATPSTGASPAPSPSPGAGASPAPSGGGQLVTPPSGATR